MRLYLSSYGLGDQPEHFTRLVRGARRGWVIANALDGLDEDRRNTDTIRQIEALAVIGLQSVDLDLRRFDPASIDLAFGRPDFVWVRGGNVFTLRMAMATSGLDSVIVEGLAADQFVYGGFSAGSCVLAPSLAGLEACDPPEVCLATCGNVRYDGLAVLDRPVVPHLNSPQHPETGLLTRVAEKYLREGQPYWALSDGQALVMDGRQLALAH